MNQFFLASGLLIAARVTRALARISEYATPVRISRPWLTWLTASPQDAAGASPHGDAFAVDAAAVGEVDAAGVQLLLSLSHALRREHRVLRLCNPSQALAAACGALGVHALLAASATIGATT